MSQDHSHDFLWMLKEEHQKFVLDNAEPVTFAKGDWIIKTGDEAHFFYLVQSGHAALDVDLAEGAPKRILTLGKGDILGWSWMVPPYQWQFSCQAQEEVKALKVDVIQMRKLCETDHEFGYQLMTCILRMMKERITATRMQLIHLND